MNNTFYKIKTKKKKIEKKKLNPKTHAEEKKPVVL